MNFGHVLGHQAHFQVLDRQHVAIAHHQIDVVERDALGLQAIVDDILKKAGVVLLARDPLLADRERDLAVAKQARAGVMVVGIDPEDIDVLFRHGILDNGRARLRRSGGPRAASRWGELLFPACVYTKLHLFDMTR